jgi:hypothetical protein
LDEYIHHHRTPPIENEAGGCGYQRGMAGMEMQRKQQTNVWANIEIYCGIEGVLVLFLG